MSKILKNFVLCISCLAALGSASAQRLSASGKAVFNLHQDSLMRYADEIVNAREPNQRFRADSFFIRLLVRTLKRPNSFYYPFDSLQSISKLYAPDSSFRIFTWQVKKDEYIYIQRGAIQKLTSDGSLKLIPLHDVSMFTSRPDDSVRTADDWIGAIYYRIIEKSFQGKKIYTLLGFDSYNLGSNKKWMEILTFNEQGDPVFGGPYFSFKDDSAKASKKIPMRFNIEYSKEAGTTFNYDSTLDMIIFDHLVSESGEPSRKDSYVPDGDYEGFRWQNGQWLHVVKVFNSTLKDGQYPQDLKILNDAGGIDENKLKEQSEENRKKK
ncbi:MAG: hypothetical protein Q8918_16780 [Bacteroidota bacterium]|nr:hypothetical protein [Bacteroidota bacterium]